MLRYCHRSGFGVVMKLYKCAFENKMKVEVVDGCGLRKGSWRRGGGKKETGHWFPSVHHLPTLVLSCRSLDPSFNQSFLIKTSGTTTEHLVIGSHQLQCQNR